MRHRKNDKRLGRSTAHREALMASLVCNLIHERRIKTTLPKAKQARSVAEKMVTLARKKNVTARRRAISTLKQEGMVRILFDDIAPRFEGRAGGYTRIIKLGRRSSDSSEMALLEWVGIEVPDKRKKKKVDAKAKAEGAEPAEAK